MTLSLILAALASYFINNTKTMARGSCVINEVTFFSTLIHICACILTSFHSSLFFLKTAGTLYFANENL